MTGSRIPKLSGFSLNRNGLKLIALVSMTIGHVGLIFFPTEPGFRIVGRLAFPLFAYMVAEGCRYTRNRKRYLGRIWGLALVCQTVYSLYAKDLYLCVLVTFGLSIPTVFALRDWRTGPGWWNRRLIWLIWWIAVDAGICLGLPKLLAPWGFAVDYGFWGVFLPVLLACSDRRLIQLALAAVGFTLLSWSMGGIQWACLAALPILALYNGTRGTWRLKYPFYIYYPAHLVVLEGLAMLI